jgi:predicted nucleic acid-binding protein
MIDTSALIRAQRQPAVATRLNQIPLNDRFTCLPIILELGVSARNTREHAAQLGWVRTGARRAAITPEIEERAIAVQGLLVAQGTHRSARLSDLIIAAVAEVGGHTVLHYDSDFEIVADVTGQPVEWVVARGSVS